MDESGKPLLTMLRRLPPSKELLDFYHKKLEQFSSEEEKWLERLSEAKRASDRSIHIERELIASKREIGVLQKAVVDIKNALVQERKINLKLQTENDKLRIRELENRRKVIALLDLTGRSDKEITKVLDDGDKLQHKSNMASDLDQFLPQRLVDFMEKAKSDPARFASLKRSTESCRLEVLALENQILEQERCHLEQLSEFENERRLTARDREAERSQFERRITELSQALKSVEENQESFTNELVSLKSNFRKEEKSWMSEKEFLLRKIQFVEHYGTGFPCGDPSGAFHTDQRAGARKGGEIKAHRDLQKLNTELAEQRKQTEDYRTRLLSLEAEMDCLKDQNQASKEVLKQRTRAMVEQVEHLKDKYESLENRRKNESCGYQNDVKILKEKLRHLEQKLIRATIGKVKEHDYIKTINGLEREVDQLKRTLKSSGEWHT